MTNILIAASGTGGHVIPAKTVAEELLKLEYNLHWLGTKNGIENQIKLPNIQLHNINFFGFKGKNILHKIKLIFLLCKAIVQVILLLRKHKIDIVFCFGSYISVPAGIAAFIMRKKLVIHEQNAVPGLANRIIAPMSSMVLNAFPHTFTTKYSPITTGNPISKNMLEKFVPLSQRLKTEDLPLKKLNILILGGSQGATFINNLMPSVLKLFNSDERPNIIHQCGKQNLFATQQEYIEKQIQAKVIDFTNDMSELYNWAHLVICRAGALTISELTCAGIGALFIPYASADSHQKNNAQFIVEHNGGMILNQKVITAKELYNILQDIMVHQDKILEYANNIQRLAPSQKNSVNTIIKNIKTLITN